MSLNNLVTEYHNTELAQRVCLIKLREQQNALRDRIATQQRKHGRVKRLRALLNASMARSLEVEAGDVWP